MAADLLLVNGVVRTMDPARPAASAVALRGGRILAVGTRDEARAVLGAQPEIVDLGGRCVLPGLTDSHLHFRWYAESLDGVNAETPTLEQALDRVRERPGRQALARGSQAMAGTTTCGGEGGSPAATTWTGLPPATPSR